jgi:hypothetical protein
MNLFRENLCHFIFDTNNYRNESCVLFFQVIYLCMKFYKLKN